jgi:hypothetical protein
MNQLTIRRPGYVEFVDGGEGEGGWRIWRARGKTFLVEWCEATALGSRINRRFNDETIAVFPAAGGTVTIADIEAAIPERAIAIIPAGEFSLSCAGAGYVVLLSPIRPNVTTLAINERDYDNASAEGMQTVPRSCGISRPLQIIPVDEIVPPADKPRLKIVRSETMSVSWIEYSGLRDRTKLSPHDHDDFEQGSLAVEGQYIHHLRTPWGPDATQWRDDVHLKAAPRSLCIIPPRVLHTTEGEGDGKHILIDIFAPARADFIESGWVFNSATYHDEA